MPETNLSVKLVDYTPNPEKIVADAARVCYADNDEIAELFGTTINSVDDARMIKMLANMGHLSPFEHVKWTYFVQGVSRALTHQLVRHRIASYSQRSQRYVEQKDFDFIIPPTIEKAGMAGRYREMMNTIGGFYEELAKGLEEKLGLTGEARNQDARYVLPNACETKIAVTMNGRELMDVFFNERLCNRAQWEIRAMAREMLEQAYPTAPNIFAFAGPSCCTKGTCYQGKKSCGKAEEVRAYFESLKQKAN